MVDISHLWFWINRPNDTYVTVFENSTGGKYSKSGESIFDFSAISPYTVEGLVGHGFIRLSDYFHDDSEIICDNEKSQLFSMVYGDFELEISRKMYLSYKC